MTRYSVSQNLINKSVVEIVAAWLSWLSPVQV